jgi:hypothetical protein
VRAAQGSQPPTIGKGNVERTSNRAGKPIERLESDKIGRQRDLFPVFLTPADRKVFWSPRTLVVRLNHSVGTPDLPGSRERGAANCFNHRHQGERMRAASSQLQR